MGGDKKTHSVLFPRPCSFISNLIFPYVLFALHHYPKQNGVAMAMLREFVCNALGSGAVGGLHTASKEEDDIKEPED